MAKKLTEKQKEEMKKIVNNEDIKIRQKYLTIINKKRYDSFLENLEVCYNNYLKRLITELPRVIDLFVFINKELYYLNNRTAQLIPLRDKDFKNLIKNHLGSISGFVNTDALQTYIKTLRTFSNIKYTVNPFEKENKILVDKDKREITVIKNKIYLKKPKVPEISEEQQQKIIKDYMEHWGNNNEFIDFLDFVIYMRFTQDRKKSFLNLNAMTNWGKGFLIGIFSETLNIGIKVVDSDLKEDKPLGFTENQFLNASVLFIDEFKKFRNHLFTITHELQLEPKFGFKTSVPLFAKILLNFDKSESFTYLVDKQITNRVIVMEIKTKKELQDRELYFKDKVNYKLTIANYIYNYFNKIIEKLTKKGEVEANKIADKRLQEIYKKYSIKNTFNIEETIKETIYTFLLKIKEETDRLTLNEQKIKTNIYIEQGNFYITKTIQTLINILQNELDETEFSKIKYKKGSLLSILEKEQKTYRINKIPKKAVKITLDEIQEYLDKNIEISECDNNFKAPINFIYELRRYLDIKDYEFEIENDEITFYTIQKYSLNELNEQLRQIYDCNKEEMLKQFADNIRVYASLREINEIYNQIPQEEKEVIEITEEELENAL